MCGIAGMIGTIDDANRAAVERMSAAMVHRGPDAAGVWTSDADDDGRGCLLAHRRLSIIDLNSVADQPMTDTSSGTTLVFNGEIYNYRSLRSPLESVGESFRTASDTEVLLRWLSLRGPAGVESLRGMYSFGLWEPAGRRLLLGRDPHGIKPLYVAENPEPGGTWQIIFASELRAILASGLLGRPRLDPAGVASYVWNGFVPGPTTIVDGIRSITPGAVVEVADRSAMRTIHLSSLDDGETRVTSEIDDLPDALAESVSMHLVSDVPLGVFLSSGVDSAVVAHLAHRASAGSIRTFTLSFDDPALSEAEASASIARAIGTDHRSIELSEADFIDSLDEAFGAIDQPTFDGLNTYAMSRAVRDAGLTVALSGTGGDELFGGYQTFRFAERFRRWSSTLPDPARSAAAWMLELERRIRRDDVGRQSRWSKLPDMLRAGPDLVTYYQLSYALFLPDFQRRLLAAPDPPGVADGLPSSLHERLHDEAAGLDALSAIAALEQRCFLGERLLRDSDTASMAVSLEYRTPFVDRELTRFVRRLPPADRFGTVGTKSALRKAGLAGLDEALFDRPKQGFQLPFDRWIRRGLGTEMDETMRDADRVAAAGLSPSDVAALWSAFLAGRPGLYWSRVWSLYVLIRWCNTYGVDA